MTSNQSQNNLRILIIEDDVERTKRICSWFPDDIRPVIATSAGRAIGILKRDRGKVYPGIMMDHDLQGQTATESDRSLSGNDVVESVIRHISKEVPVFIHSVNIQQGPVMATKLENAGFWVTRVPMFELTKDILQEWIDDVRDVWDG